MQKSVFFLLSIVMLCGVSTCFAGDADVLKQYSSQKALDDSKNKSGFSIKDVGTFQDMHTIDIYFKNPRINQEEENNKVATGRLQIFNAENPGASVTHQRASAKVTTKKPDGSSTMYYGARFFVRSPKPRYAIVYFKGIPASEAAEVATPASFFIISLDADKPRVLTENPLLAGDLFK